MRLFLSGWEGPAHLFLVLLVAGTLLLSACPCNVLQVSAWRRADPAIARHRWVIPVLLVLWALAVTSEFWLLGDRSFVMFGDEGEVSFPYFSHLAALPHYLRFDPAVLGGADSRSLFTSGSNLLPLDVWMFHLLGSDLAFTLHKVLNTLLATAGAFALARKGVKASFIASLAVGCAYSVSFFYVITVTLGTGLGYALIPLGLYVLIYRLDKPFYLAGCVLFGLLVSSSMTVTHSNLAFYTALFCGACYNRVITKPRFLLGASLVTAIIVIVWLDVLYALASFAGYTLRGTSTAFYAKKFSLGYVWDALARQYFFEPSTLIVLAASLLPYGWNRRWISAAALCLGPWFIAVAWVMMPFSSLGLEKLRAIDPVWLFMGSAPLLVIVLAQASVAVAERGQGTVPAWRVRMFSAFLVMFPLSLFAGYKWLHVNALANGSSRNIYHLHNVEVLAENMDRRYRVLAGPDWRAGPYYFSDDVLLAYGLPTIGGLFNLVDRWHYAFWLHAGDPDDRGYVGLASTPDCVRPRPLDNTALFRIAGVRYVVSRTPLEAPGMILLSGPKSDTLRPCNAGLASGLAALRHEPADAFIYELPLPLPLFYFAKAVQQSGQGLQSGDFWNAVAREGVNRVAISTDPVSPRTYDGEGTLKVVTRENGYSVTTNSHRGEMLVIGHPRFPFWRVFVDGNLASLISVNGIQMAVAIPAGLHTVELRYARWLPSDAIKKWF